MHDFRPEPRARARDAGLDRLRRTTRVAIFGATALAGAFAGMAAESNPGHKAPAVAAPVAKRRLPRPAVQGTPTATQVETPTPAPAAAPPPPPPPVATTVAPVATTGAT